VVTGITIFVLDNGPDTRGAAQSARARAGLIADSVLQGVLRPDDLRSPPKSPRRAALDRSFRRQVLRDGVLRATVRGPAGAITYAGAAHSGQNGPTVTTTVPLSVGSAHGTLTLDQDAAVLGGSGGPPLKPLLGIVAVLLAGLGLAMAPTLRRHRKRLRHHAAEMEQMQHQAFHDTLTGLPNRALFHDRVEQALRASRRDGSAVAVMLMDLDRFKEINDTFGHLAGDRLLCEVGEHIGHALRDSDSVARLGGDEFAVLADRVAGPVGAMALAERALQEVERTYAVCGVELDVDASIGIALFPHHGRDVEALLRCADIAMYQSKASGAPTLYALEHDHHSADRLALGTQLRRALSQGEIVVHYQPKADFGSGRISSVEALVRWQHSERGLLAPDQFIPLAEQTGLIRQLTTLVLDSALAQCRRWSDAGLDLSVAVNITGRDLLDQRFSETVKSLLHKWEVPPSHLELEITENTVLSDPIRARTVLLALSDFGVRLAIDDFGSGNSSLSYLKRLPINVLKIDKSFVLQMHIDDDDAVIVRSTIDLGHNLGLKVVAEGVNSIRAWNRLRQLGCDMAQGYYLSRPVPGPEIEVLLAAERASAAIEYAEAVAQEHEELTSELTSEPEPDPGLPLSS
jgi:diguanylate cyclase (GGDEF)-like protein